MDQFALAEPFTGFVERAVVKNGKEVGKIRDQVRVVGIRGDNFVCTYVDRRGMTVVGEVTAVICP